MINRNQEGSGADSNSRVDQPRNTDFILISHEEVLRKAALKNGFRRIILGLLLIPVSASIMGIIGLNSEMSIKAFAIFTLSKFAHTDGEIKSAKIEGEQRITIYAVAILMFVIGGIILALFKWQAH